MRRPDITVGRRNMLLNLGMGAGWVISASFGCPIPALLDTLNEW